MWIYGTRIFLLLQQFIPEKKDLKNNVSEENESILLFSLTLYVHKAQLIKLCRKLFKNWINKLIM